MNAEKLTLADINSVLHYDPETGLFRWLVDRGPARVGDVAGNKAVNGYITIRINRKMYLAHRLAWLVLTGEWPSCSIDHVNGVRDDNRASNLRECTVSENAQNAKLYSNNNSGHPGVSWHGQCRKWQAQIMVSGRRKSLGLYASPEIAGMVYRYWKRRLHSFNPTVRAE